jgi:hypothetical protein
VSKFIVLYGKNNTPGTAGTRYEIFDTVKFDPKKDYQSQMRKYTFRKFYEKGRIAWRLRKEVFYRKRNIILYDGRIFAEKVRIFDHECTNEYFAFVPVECFKF